MVIEGVEVENSCVRSPFRHKATRVTPNLYKKRGREYSFAHSSRSHTKKINERDWR